MNISDQSRVQNMPSSCVFNTMVTCTCSGISLHTCSSVILTRPASISFFIFSTELIWNMAKVKWLFFLLLFYTVVAVAVLELNGEGDLPLAVMLLRASGVEILWVLFWRLRTRNFVAKVHFLLFFVKSCTGFLFKNVHTVNCCFYEYLVTVQTMYRL